MTILWIGLAFFAGYFIGHKLGVIETLMKVQGLISQLQEIEEMFKRWETDWKEDRF